MSPPEDKSELSRRTQFYKGVLELSLLSLLDDGPQYGLQLLENLKLKAGLELSEGTLYPLLHRLEKQGLIISEWQIEATASHPRKYYKLTPSGHDELSAQTQLWLSLSQTLNQFLTRKAV